VKGKSLRSSDKRRVAPPCAKLVSRIRRNSLFLLSLHARTPVSLTECATFLRDGVLDRWLALGVSRRHRVILWAAKRARPQYPLERHVLLPGRNCQLIIYAYKPDDLLTSILVLEALRTLSKTHHPDLGTIEEFQRQWSKYPGFYARSTPRVFCRFLQHLANTVRLVP
jgi:hypothetical protein